MRRYAAAYERVTGMTLCPGSLNVVLDEQWELPRERVRLEAPEVGVGVSLVRCTFLDRPAFIFRTDADDAKGPEQRAIIEILSDVHLRDTYGLEDGDSVEIRIPN